MIADVYVRAADVAYKLAQMETDTTHRRNAMPATVYLKEHRTFTLKGPRHSGHSTAARRIAGMLKGVLVSQFPPRRDHGPDVPVTPPQYVYDAIARFQPAVVVVDDASDMKPYDLEAIYRDIAASHADVFVFLIG